MKKNSTLIIILFFTSAINAQNLNLFEKEIFINEGDTLKYRILKPENFDQNKIYPLHLFLHGAGERGNDNELQLVHGAKLFLNKENRKEFNSWVIFPQCASNDYWANMSFDLSDKESMAKMRDSDEPNPSLSLVLKLMDLLVQKKQVNTDKVYVSGLSMGGMGTFEILFRRPNMFAAATPICGDGIPQYVSEYAKKVPLWIFHGSSDKVVSPRYSLKMANAIIAAGGSPKITFYENVGHNSWNNAFSEVDFLKWIHSKTKN